MSGGRPHSTHIELDIFSRMRRLGYGSKEIQAVLGRSKAWMTRHTKRFQGADRPLCHRHTMHGNASAANGGFTSTEYRFLGGRCRPLCHRHTMHGCASAANGGFTSTEYRFPGGRGSMLLQLPQQNKRFPKCSTSRKPIDPSRIRIFTRTPISVGIGFRG